MAKIKIIPYGHQWLDNKDIKEVVKVLKSDWLTQGPKIEEFEKAVARYCGAKYGVAVSSGTAALHLSFIVAGLKPGDEIITTPLTFAATSNMAVICGAKPVFADIKSDTLNINSDLIEGLITDKTKAIVTVDFAGHPCDYDKIFKIAKKHNFLVIEDACHALGAEYKDKKVGSFSDMTILSFHPVKHITTGEGGMVLTNNKYFYEKLK
ncbi:MAG: aminotransferase class I/II-fold pyridoxal phosphate-dependent enzyme, partial [Patescibacteria group bacterium]